MKILINTPPIGILGGVSKHYLGLKAYWKQNVKYNFVGKRSTSNGRGVYWLPFDIIKFFIVIICWKPDVIVLNPSLSRNAMTRDKIFLQIAKLLRFKISVFLHGFEWEYIEKTSKERLSSFFNKADLIFVLASTFKNEMLKWGVTTPIVLSTTKVDDALVKCFDISIRTGIIKKILYLARLEKVKGVYIAINTFEILKKKYPYLEFTIVGDGAEMKNVLNYIEEKSIKDIHITGALSGKELIKEYINADLYLFPTYHREGMPASVLEAMAFGLPVVTRKVGGLVDFFENYKMGYMTESLEPSVFADITETFINDITMSKEVCQYNYIYANKHFLASKVASKVEKELEKIIER